MIGFPLRLLAREVYDRVVKIKGSAQVALITGEEKILPPQARYYLCTAESMPSDREVAFVGLDEAQLGADLERGHVFTDRLLHRRGYAETMILGSATLSPLIRRLLPQAEIVSRPRFSTLTYTAPTKLSRLPKRSAIVAFNADEVYALAEMLRRHKGGAAVVMGGLSPRTRNAQVALYQSGEVDYLVATDAIGMGLNMDIAQVAFAGLSKFDGRRHRRLTTPEMAQDRRARRAASEGWRVRRRATRPGCGHRLRRRGGRRDRGACVPAVGVSGLAQRGAGLRDAGGTDRLVGRKAPHARTAPCRRCARLCLAQTPRQGGLGPIPREGPRAARSAVAGVRAARFPEDGGGRTHAACRAGLSPPQRRAGAFAARVDRGRGGAARQCAGRYRATEQPHRGRADMDVHEPPARLACRQRALGGADARGWRTS